MKVDWASATDVGRVRGNNEDSVLALPDIGLAVLSDGMGGHRGGEVASRVAVSTFAQSIQFCTKKIIEQGASPEEEQIPGLIASTCMANQAVYHRAHSDEQLQGMGCTLVALRLLGGRAFFVSVGDSRLYLMRDRRLYQVTEDHTRLRMLERMGVSLAPAEIRQIRGVLLRAIGTHGDVEIDYGEGSAAQGDIWLLCSDGLTDEVSDAEICAVLKESRSAADAAQRCVQHALKAGGRDNVSVIVAWVVEGSAGTADGVTAPALHTWTAPMGSSSDGGSPNPGDTLPGMEP